MGIIGCNPIPAMGVGAESPEPNPSFSFDKEVQFQISEEMGIIGCNPIPVNWSQFELKIVNGEGGRSG